MAVRRRHRRAGVLYGAGAIVGVVLVTVGLVLSVRGYRADDGPGGAVRGYFTALARGKAATALAYGTVPAGPHQLLIPAVLREQLHTAPLRKFAIERVERHGASAQVHVRYQLAFAGDPQQVTTTVSVTHRTGHWRLVHVAVATQLNVATAHDRVVTFGARPANGVSLIFPGALPLSLDTQLLALDPRSDHVELAAPPATDVVVGVSARGTELARAAVLSALRSCLAGSTTGTCPQPAGRYVPDSLRGTLVPGTAPLGVSVTGAAGVLAVSGTVTVTGRYQRLTFTDRTVSGSGQVSLPVSAQSYATTPLRFVWSST